MSATGAARAHARWELGYQVWYTTHRHRVFDALGPSVNKFELTRGAPLVGVTGTEPYWGTTALVEAGGSSTEIVAPIAAGVAARMTTAGNEYDGGQVQASGAAFTLTAAMPMWFGAKVAINHATSTDLYIGLCETRAPVMDAASHVLHASTKSHVGFYKYDGGTATQYTAEKSGAALPSSADTMTTSAITYEMYWNGTTLKYYIDGTVVGSVTGTTNLPATGTALRPTFVFRNGSVASRQCDIYWWRVIQTGQ
jgi:hypothetical protein